MSTLKTWYLPFTLAIALAACGGSGEDNGGGGVGYDYSGKTGPALIDDGNARQLAETSYKKSSDSASMYGYGKQPTTAASMTAAGEALGLQGAVDVMGTALSALPARYRSPAAANGDPLMRAASSDSGMEPGSCGGTMTYTGTADEQTGQFNFSLHYSDYCESGTTLNGSMGISGTFSEQRVDMTLTFNSLQAEISGQKATLIGTMDMNMQGTAVDMTMNLVMQGEPGGEMVWLNNLQVRETSATDQTGSYSKTTLQGRIYVSQEGYVDITTETPFRAGEYDTYPSAGSMKITGADGTWATLTATAAGSYRIEADTTGDGEIDYREEFPWMM